MAEPRLSNCPFCKSRSEFWRDSDTGSKGFDGDFVRCTNGLCDAYMGPVFMDEGARKHLAEKWNKRPDIHKARKDLQRAKIFTAGRLEDNKRARQRR